MILENSSSVIKCNSVEQKNKILYDCNKVKNASKNILNIIEEIVNENNRNNIKKSINN